MEQFEDELETLQECVFAREVQVDLGKPCSSCGTPDAPFRCPECFQPSILCLKCIKQAHRHLPFHFIEQWTGLYFKRTTLHEHGFVVRLGHLGAGCPNRRQNREGRITTLVHMTGVQDIRVEYCECDHAPGEVQQLCHARLFPATLTRPETVFTFAVLDDFYYHMVASKKSAMDHYRGLQNLTDAASPEDVSVSVAFLSFTLDLSFHSIGSLP
jgi:hypothetical protein